eukprot:scaffold8374_cov175-Amphora_coffeaeformis.AAC.10
MTTSKRSHPPFILAVVAILCFCESRVDAFCGSSRLSLSMTTRQNAWSPTRLNEKDKDTHPAASLQQEEEEESAIQDTRITIGGNLFQDDSEVELNLYNAVPLFTGGIFMLLSLALTGYMFYAGLTGDDPLTGHPK